MQSRTLLYLLFIYLFVCLFIYLIIYNALTILWYGTHNRVRLKISVPFQKKKITNTTNLNTLVYVKFINLKA